MKKFEFLITDENGNTRIETFATAKNTTEAAYDFAIKMFPDCDIRLRRDIVYRWWYLAAGFAAGSLISSVMLYVLSRNMY
ncbi:hypothetical protein [Chitinophaga sp. LS1]|uniref:hypothetical protein n=1 Tax=Chitinophaga sp. LS1 TaxID=3051176 RepID=UPI002AABFD0B|nr:hypothetical protein [Chitinophaga sp. LS1]WPV66321.1 hypothetical protein QQL36_31480 [Chitinophaga sp. LS1]